MRAGSRLLSSSLLSCAVLSIALLACKKDDQKAPDPAGSAAAQAGQAAGDLEAWLADDTRALTPGIYEQLVVALEKCTLTERGIDSDCEEYKRLQTARNRNTALKDLAGMNSQVGAKFIGHESPTVRYQAASLMSSLFGSGQGTQKVILEAAEKEKNPVVLAKLLNVVGSSHGRNAEVKTLLLKMADHDAEGVRQEAMSWFLTSFGKDVDGTFEKVLEKMDKDPSLEVRKYLCSRLYGSGDPRALPVFKKYLTGTDTPKELTEGCFAGVINAWTGFPKPKEPSREAYEITLAFLKRTPRSDVIPPWQNMSNMRAAHSEFEDKDSFGKEWHDKVKGWYKKPALLAALEQVVHDSNANWMARTGALSTMNDLKVGKAKLDSIAARYASAKAGDGGDFHVKNSAERLAKAPK